MAYSKIQLKQSHKLNQLIASAAQLANEIFDLEIGSPERAKAKAKLDKMKLVIARIKNNNRT